MRRQIWHEDVRGMAVDVKDHYASGWGGGTDEQRQRAYEEAQEKWWEDARDVARGLGYDGCVACGRSGGWCAPFHEEKGWTGGGPRHMQFVDPDDVGEMALFNKFVIKIDKLMRGTEQRFADALENVIKCDREWEEITEREAGIRHDMRVLALRVLKANSMGVEMPMSASEALELVDYWEKVWALE